MKPEDKYYFNLLKQAISDTFLSENSAPALINEWKGGDIITFQEDLFAKVKTRVSEKWFYTYIKNEPNKLPRIDILNLLSVYIGFQNWTAFKNAQQIPIAPKEHGKPIKKQYYLFLLLPLIAGISYFMSLKNEFHFCFKDENSGDAIHAGIDIQILQEFESPLYQKTDSSGCFSYVSKARMIKFVVQSPYYKTDTITRLLDSGANSMINLQTDDYALMLHYYSSGNVNDLKKRKLQLQNLFAEGAQIYQVFSNNMGVELYSKSEFINKLTVPTSSLKNIVILDKSYQNEKIVKLKFMVK